MAKKAVADQEPETTPEASSENPPSSHSQSVAGYFRPIFEGNPGLLKVRSNEFLYQKWLQDHPGHTEVPENVKQSLSNLKSILRHSKGKKFSKKGRPRPEEPGQEAAPTTAIRPPRQAMAWLEQLEQSIDDALALAKHIDREGLEEVIRLLRAARNRVVVQMGE